MGWYQRGSGYTVQIGLTVYRATAALPQTATSAIFTVSGGRIILRGLLGEVTTAIQAQATTLKVQSNPTLAGTSVDLAATMDINAAPVGQLFGIVGVFATAMQQGLAIVLMTTPQILQAGTIDLVTGASSTGSAKWSLIYSPWDAGALVTAT